MSKLWIIICTELCTKYRLFIQVLTETKTAIQNFFSQGSIILFCHTVTNFLVPKIISITIFQSYLLKIIRKHLQTTYIFFKACIYNVLVMIMFKSMFIINGILFSLETE